MKNKKKKNKLSFQDMQFLDKIGIVIDELQFPDLYDKLITFAFNEQRKASKDVDQIRDTGGKFQNKSSDRPGRDDLKKHKRNPRKMLKQDRQDYKDTLFDKDLKE